MGKHWMIVWMVGAAAWGACGGSSSGPGGTLTTVPVEQNQFAARFTSSVCSSMASCCRANSFTYDSQVCTDAMRGQLQAVLLRYQGLNVTYDAAAAAACIDAYAGALRACEGSLSAVDEPCEHLFTGNVPIGGACTESVECAREPGQSAYCDAGLCIVDTYRDPLPGVAGEACIGTCTRSDGGYGCSSGGSVGTGGAGGTTGTVYCFTNDGLHCVSATGVCEELPTLGQACDFDGCAGPNYCLAGTCTPQIETGACADSRTCIMTSYCDFTVSQCAPRKANGQPCEFDEECQAGNCADAICGPQVPVNATLCVGLLD